MDRKAKQEKKRIIGQAVDLANGRFKDDEVDTLLGIVENPDKYDGLSKTYKYSSTGWYSEGKYTRDETTTYTVHNDETGISIDEHYEFQDDDGYSGGHDKTYNTGREILNIFKSIFD